MPPARAASTADPVPRTTAPASTAAGDSFDFDWKRVPVLLGAAVLLVYTYLSGNIAAPIVAIGLAWVFLKVGPMLDGPLAPFWSARDVIPRGVRSGLAWVVSLVIGYGITLYPPAFRYFAWIPFLDHDSSIFVCTTIIAGVVAYLLVREPQASAA